MDMDVNEKDKMEVEERNADCMDYHSHRLRSDWQYNGVHFVNSGLIPNGSSMIICKGDAGLMVGSLERAIWQQQHASDSEHLGFSGIDVHNGASGSADTCISDPLGLGKGPPGALRSEVEMGWNGASSVLKGGLFLPNVPGMLPPCLSHFPTDSAFIERAARFSCFNAGNFTDMMNPMSPIGVHQSISPYFRGGAVTEGPQEVFSSSDMKAVIGGQQQTNDEKMAKPSGENGLTGQSLQKSRGEMSSDEAKQTVSMTGNESEEAEFSSGGQEEAGGEPSSAKGVGAKKRKRGVQGVELEQQSGEATKTNDEIKRKGDENPTSTNNRTVGKQGKQCSEASDPPKEEYIHVRARRGQATNSHSLAERVRREKISERMKFLQDLVPGCSKVTGKAVMLDEIINYVQSLQRQVEFLSMKLATVNPRLDFSVEGLLAKDMLLSRSGPAASLGFSIDAPSAYPPSQQPVLQPSLPTMVNSSMALGRTIASQLTSSGYKEPTPLLTNIWEDELHNVVQMGFSASASLDSRDTNTSQPPSNTKIEP